MQLPKSHLWLICLVVSLGCKKRDLPRLPDNLTDGLVAHYTFQGTTVNSVGSDLAGTLMNGASYGPDRANGPNAALRLDGIDDYFEILDDVKLRPTAISISVWLKPAQVLSSSHIYYKANFTDGLNQQYGAKIKPLAGEGYEWLADVKRDGVCDKGEQGTEAKYTDRTFQSAQWYHLLTTYDGQTVRLYLNGVRQAQSESATKPIDNCPGGGLRFGAAFVGDINAFNGSMDEIRIYNRVLTEREINALAKR